MKNYPVGKELKKHKCTLSSECNERANSIVLDLTASRGKQFDYRVFMFLSPILVSTLEGTIILPSVCPSICLPVCPYTHRYIGQFATLVIVYIFGKSTLTMTDVRCGKRQRLALKLQATKVKKPLKCTCYL